MFLTVPLQKHPSQDDQTVRNVHARRPRDMTLKTAMAVDLKTPS